MFRKLFANADIDYQVLDQRIEFDLDSQGNKIQYSNVTSQYLDDFMARLGDHARHFHTSFVNIEATVPPHTDIVDQVNINFYIETGDYRTTFYRSTNNSARFTYADHGDGHAYRMEDLQPIDSFVAQPGDVYVLNGKIIHGVTCETAVPRKVLQVSSRDLEYGQVIDILSRIC
jgi:hypothetical protein